MPRLRALLPSVTMNASAATPVCSYSFYDRGVLYCDDAHATVSTRGRFCGYDRVCPYCDAALDKHSESKLGESKPYNDTQKVTDFLVTNICRRCGWWFATQYSYCYHDITTIYCAQGVAKHYPLGAIDIPIVEMRNYLAKHPDSLAHVNERRFELLMQDCLKDQFGPCEVIHTGRTGDGGVDLKMILSDFDTYLVQVKRRSNILRSEGVDVVRSLNGVLFREGAAKGMVITTAKSFTKAAKAEAHCNTPTLETYDMKLVAFDDVVSMLRLPRRHPYEPWEDAIEQCGLAGRASGFDSLT